jgi:hypothetical protein
MPDQLNIVSQLSELKSRDKVSLRCLECQQLFNKPKNKVQAYIKNYPNIDDYDYRFCSPECRGLFRGDLIKTNCKHCGKKLIRQISTLKKNKFSFCSQRCSGKYSALHRKTGTRRAKLEKWLETHLNILYPTLNIIYNDTSAIQAELDIYFPSLNLAIELNGIFHYEPIYGLEKLSKTQIRDKQKILTCAHYGIELCVIDTTKHRYFKEKHCKPYLDIITNIINNKLVSPENSAISSSSSQN